MIFQGQFLQVDWHIGIVCFLRAQSRGICGIRKHISKLRHDKVQPSREGMKKTKAESRFQMACWCSQKRDRIQLNRRFLTDTNHITFTSVIAMKPHKEYTKKTKIWPRKQKSRGRKGTESQHTELAQNKKKKEKIDTTIFSTNQSNI